MVNLAARLAAAAEKDSKGVLCDENTLKGIYGTVRAVSRSLYFGLKTGKREKGVSSTHRPCRSERPVDASPFCGIFKSRLRSPSRETDIYR